MTIKQKLGLVGLVTVIVVFFIGGITYYLNQSLKGALETYKFRTGQLEQLFHLNSTFLKVSELYNNAVVLAMMGEGSEKITKRVKETMGEYDILISELEKMKEIEISGTLKVLAELRKKVDKGFEIIRGGDSYGASEYYMSSLKNLIDKVKQDIVSIVKAEKKIIEKDYAQSLVQYSKHRNIAFAIIIALLVALVAFALIIFSSITKPILITVKGLTAVSDYVASTSQKVSSASQSLAEGASQQAASVEETSSSLEEMASMTKQNAESANQADVIMKEANQVVSKANESMTELTSSMAEISRASEETSKIIKTIDEIAFQTNLLALNAAVEAARAGEAGAGFAVVAEEVRNLAMRAADAAKNTSELIEVTVTKIHGGSELVTRTNNAFSEVTSSTVKVGDLVGEIAAASGEQAEGIEQINRAVSEMDKVIQQNTANAEIFADAFKELDTQTTKMSILNRKLAEEVNGAGKVFQQLDNTAETLQLPLHS
jgi:methyl-accepting chemotaxis protein